jgi:undecaprenyl-diphosphatase
MFAATAKKLLDFYKEGPAMTHDEIKLLAIGNIIAFVVAMFAIKTFISFLTKHGFKFFGYYRIFAGVVILAMIYFGYHLKM